MKNAHILHVGVFFEKELNYVFYANKRNTRLMPATKRSMSCSIV